MRTDGRLLATFALLSTLVSACVVAGDCPCGYTAHIKNASDSAVLIQFRNSPYKIGDEPTQYAPGTVFVVPAHGTAASPRVYMDWADGPLFGPPLPLGQIVLVTGDCDVLASVDIHRGDDPQVAIGADGSSMELSSRPVDGPVAALESSKTACPAS